MQTVQTPSTTLYYRAGSSDKVYRIAIEPSGDGFVVNFAYGRRGGAMNTGTKTAKPVDFDAARMIFDKLVAEKTAKGYTPGEDGTPYQETPNADRATGVVPQLLNAIDEEQANQLLADAAWCTQEKFDGRRVLIRKSGQDITGINRKGLVISLPAPIVTAAQTCGSQQWLIDGECIGDVFHAFDLLENACVDLRQQPYEKRLLELVPMFAAESGSIRSVPTAVKTRSKRAMLDQLRQDQREGIVFKRLAAAYTPGRPNSGGDHLKLKFTATASCIVAGVNGSRRSVRLELIDGGRRLAIGNVTIPSNHSIPAPGSVAEVRYLYANEGGSLYQPVYLGQRDDIQSAACTVDQLKFKGTDEEG